MKTYPSIQHWRRAPRGHDAYVFHKYDGSNLRAEINLKSGEIKCGSRRMIIGENTTLLGAAVPQLKRLTKEVVAAIMADKKLKKEVRGAKHLTLFYEWWGPNSFAGAHPDPLAAMRLTLIDVWIHKRGFLLPKLFLKLIEGKEWGPTFYGIRKVNQTLKEEVAGWIEEGVICKWAVKKPHKVEALKIKSKHWIDRLKTVDGKLWEEENNANEDSV